MAMSFVRKINDSATELTVDYDESTDLFKMIEDRNWFEVVRHANEKPDEVKTWVYRLDKNSEQVGMMLPIHAAIVEGAPLSVIKALVEIYPGCVEKPDGKGNLPIHLSANFFDPDDEVINYLLRKYPEGLQSISKTGISIVDYANLPELHQLLIKKKWDEAIWHVQSYPDEAMTWIIHRQKKDDITVRFLALHLAIYDNAPENVIDALLEAFPKSVECMDDEGMIPLQLELLKKRQNNNIVKKLLKPLMYKEGKTTKVDIPSQRVFI